MADLRRSSLLHRRVITAQLFNNDDLEDNDDEAERLVRRERSFQDLNSSRIDFNQSTGPLNQSLHLSANELNSQIAECIKLNNENKINDKNAFQLKMIDFLIYALKKHDPNMSNFQMASASLDASSKIYGCRVDKVYGDLLKILGVKQNQQNENQDNELDQAPEKEKEKRVKKKKKNQQQIFLIPEKLKASLDTYDPLALIKIQRDTQTSDLLFQANCMQHANHGVLFNYYRDVILDRVQYCQKPDQLMFLVPTIDNFHHEKICLSYDNFKFNCWSSDDEEMINQMDDNGDLNQNDYHFDLDAPLGDNDDINNEDFIMDCDNAFEQNFNRLEENRNRNVESLEDIILHNINSNSTLEYSYVQKNYYIKLAGPSHWKVKFNRQLGVTQTVETCKQTKKKKKKELELCYIETSKEDAKAKFSDTGKKCQISNKSWSEDKLIISEEIEANVKHFHTFYQKPTVFLRICGNRIDRNDQLESNSYTKNDHNNSDSIDFGNNDGHDFDDNGDRHNFDNQDQFIPDNNLVLTQATGVTQGQGALLGDNLVLAPKLTDKIFIPYSQRAKKIDMHQLKKAMWKTIKNTSNEIEKENFDNTQEENIDRNKVKSKKFSDTYLEIPKMLSKPNAESLSPALAFVSLLHLGHEKSFQIEQTQDLSDIDISYCRSN